jgi:GH15 family glucan-1,4-alpha-glucosidase
MYQIRDYFIIGDLHTTALVSKKASIDWLCLPHFDSGTMFAGLLDVEGGTFAIDYFGYAIESSYRKDSAIVEHKFRNKEIEFFIYDYMLPQAVNVCKSHFLVRKLMSKKGTARITLRFDPRPDYGRAPILIQKKDDALVLRHKDHSLILHIPTGTSISQSEKGYLLKLSVSEGAEAAFVLEYSATENSHWQGELFEKETDVFWHEWVSRGNFFAFCRDQLVRSAITLKLMQFYPTGALVAAPTTSLPEEIGGERNWDYRYVWIRDATFILYALYVLGYTEEAVKFFEFIEGIAEDSDHSGFDMHLMYTIWGERVPMEQLLQHFSGYQNSKPVRIGNNATEQFQLDVYGSLIDAHYFMAQRGVYFSERSKSIVLAMFEKIKEQWRNPDHGIWEVRSGKKHFTYSKVMAWVGINRGLALCDYFGIGEEKQKEMRILETEIKSWIWENCYDEKQNTLFQHPDISHQDATNFLLVALKFLDKRDPRTKCIVARTADELVKQDVFVDRYHVTDGLEGDEGAFVLCTYWYISALAIIGEIEKALALFDMFSMYTDRTGLLSEEMDERTGEYLGNYPQAFSHMGYIMTAYYLNRYYYSQKKKLLK